MSFLEGDFGSRLHWRPPTLLTIPVGPTPDIERQRAAELASEPLARKSMEQVNAELAFAASVLVDAGFVEPAGHGSIPDDPGARLNWNIAYHAAAESWVASDPEWRRIGGAARYAVDLIHAGIAIQMAAMAIRRGSAPITSAVTLFNMSIVFGAVRVHLREWLEGTPQKLAAQRARAMKLKAADWYAPVEPLVLRGLDGGYKVEAIAAEALATLAANDEFVGPLPTIDAIRVKIQRVRKTKSPA